MLKGFDILKVGTQYPDIIITRNDGMQEHYVGQDLVDTQYLTPGQVSTSSSMVMKLIGWIICRQRQNIAILIYEVETTYAMRLYENPAPAPSCTI